MCKTICVQCPLLDLTVAELVSSYPAAPPPKSSSSWSTGSAPTSRKAQNKLLAGLLPDHNNGISRSLYKFSKTMLGMTHKDDDYPLELSEANTDCSYKISPRKLSSTINQSSHLLKP